MAELTEDQARELILNNREDFIEYRGGGSDVEQMLEKSIGPALVVVATSFMIWLAYKYSQTPKQINAPVVSEEEEAVDTAMLTANIEKKQAESKLDPSDLSLKRGVIRFPSQISWAKIIPEGEYSFVAKEQKVDDDSQFHGTIFIYKELPDEYNVVTEIKGEIDLNVFEMVDFINFEGKIYDSHGKQISGGYDDSFIGSLTGESLAGIVFSSIIFALVVFALITIITLIYHAATGSFTVSPMESIYNSMLGQ